MSSNNNSNNLTPRARYRAFAMIKLGEWWDAREAAFRLAVRTCVANADKYVEDEISAEDALCEILSAIRLLDSMDDDYLEIKNEINETADDDGFYKGELYMTNRYACKEHRKTIILPAEQPEADKRCRQPFVYQQETPKKEAVKDET